MLWYCLESRGKYMVVIRPIERSKVQRPQTNAACRSDQLLEYKRPESGGGIFIIKRKYQMVKRLLHCNRINQISMKLFQNLSGIISCTGRGIPINNKRWIPILSALKQILCSFKVLIVSRAWELCCYFNPKK